MDDRRMPKLEVFALSESRTRLTGSIPYKTLVWRRRYYECGQFQMQVPASVYSPEWAYIYTDDRPETGIIEKVVYSDDAMSPGGDDTVTVSGRFMECLLNQRTFLVEASEEMREVETRTVTHGEYTYTVNETVVYDVVPPLVETYTGRRLFRDDTQGGYYLEKANGYVAGQDYYNRRQKVAEDTHEPTGEYSYPTLTIPKHVAEYYLEQRGEDFIYYKTTETDTYKWWVLDEYSHHWIQIDVPREPYAEHYLVEIPYVIRSNAYYYRDGSTLRRALMDAQGGVTDTAISESDIIYKVSSTDMFVEVDGIVERTNGVLARKESTYAYKPDKLEHTVYTTETEYNEVTETYETVHYVTVKGPWQTTELGEVEREADNIAHCVEWARAMYQNTFVWEEPTFSGTVKVVDPSLRYMGDILYDELKGEEASFSVLYDFKYDKLSFRVWRGDDRTQSQTDNPWAVFSDTWGSLYGWSAWKDASAYRNKCYVLYDYEAPTQWASDGTPYLKPVYQADTSGGSSTLQGWEVPYERHRGYEVARIEDGKPDSEAVLDMRREAPAHDRDWQRSMYRYDASEPNDGRPTLPACRDEYEAYANGFEAAGLNALRTRFSVLASLDTGTLRMDGYRSQFDLGDKVDMAVEAVGLVQEARITAVDETHGADGSKLSLQIGDETIRINEEGAAWLRR